MHLLINLFQPDNILAVSTSNCTPNFQFKLADFGLAKLLTADAKGEHYANTRCGTPRYMAPEVTSNWRKYSFGADIFSLGCILAFYANQGKHLFYSQEEINKWQGIMDETNKALPAAIAQQNIMVSKKSYILIGKIGLAYFSYNRL